MLNKTIGALALASSLAVPGAALAAVTAIATSDVNLRAGPSTQYPAVDVVQGGDDVRVFGCLSDRSWCDVAYAGQRGWMSSRYLAYLRGGQRYVGPQFVTTVGAPVISFTFGSYWDNHYRGRSFYRDRARWDRRDDRRDIRDARQDVRMERRDVRDARADLRAERRAGADLTAERLQLRQEQEDVQDARRQLRRERRN